MAQEELVISASLPPHQCGHELAHFRVSLIFFLSLLVSSGSCIETILLSREGDDCDVQSEALPPEYPIKSHIVLYICFADGDIFENIILIGFCNLSITSRPLIG